MTLALAFVHPALLWALPLANRRGELLALAAIALFSGIANSARIQALAMAPASLLAPFGYTQIVTATIVGLIVFGDLPDSWSFAGIAVIVLSGLYVWHRERVRGVGAAA